MADHVANGAYFYFQFEYDSSTKPINALLDKLTERYELGISPRQRNYRLEKGHPICTLIVQRDVFKHEKWFLYLLFTTPISRDFNNFHAVEITKLAKESEKLKIQKLKEEYKRFKWDVDHISKEMNFISDYFKDNEVKQFVLNNPISIKPTHLVTLELFRDTHKSYKQLLWGDQKEYKDRVRPYTWTWRFTQLTVERIKTTFIKIINKLVSQKNTALAEKNRADLRNLFLMVETWAVFKASRSQAGQILHFSHRFLQKRAKQTWNQIQLSPPHLTYLPRLPNYADTLYEYNYRRSIFDEHGIEVPLEMIKDFYATHNNMFIQAYISEIRKKQQNAKAITKKADELYLQVLDD